MGPIIADSRQEAESYRSLYNFAVCLNYKVEEEEIKTPPYKGKLEFTSSVNMEMSAGAIQLSGNAKSIMEIEIQENGRGWVEWDIPSLNEYEMIGLIFEGKELIDYDGVMSFPKQLALHLENEGYNMSYIAG